MLLDAPSALPLGFQGFRVPGFQGSRVPGFQGFRVPGFQGLGSWSSALSPQYKSL